LIGQSNDGPVRTVLRMRARGGCEEAFENAWRAAAAEISRVPGNVRQELIRDAADPRSFLITCDWIDHAALDGFGRGALRDRVGAALHDLRESADRSTYDVLYIIGAKGPSIRVCVTVAVAPGQEAAYERAYGKVAERMRGTPGHVREELLREAGTSTYHLFAEWETEEAFNAWADDPAHNQQTAPLLPYLVESFQRTLYEIVARPPESPSGQAPFGQAPSVQAPSVQVSSVRSQAARVRAPSIAPPKTVMTDNHNGGSTVDSLTDVLVVGAGPAGLTAAIELARRGVACRLIDKNTEPSGAADKAIGIHSRTMEIWENIGIAREAMDTGTWLHGQTVYVNGRQTHQVNWDLPDLPYAHLGLPQYETERILTGLLAKHGVGIERGSELHSLVQDEDSVTARVVRTTGERGAAQPRAELRGRHGHVPAGVHARRRGSGLVHASGPSTALHTTRR
jgi:heme-degrading monooxygenase HmoA